MFDITISLPPEKSNCSRQQSIASVCAPASLADYTPTSYGFPMGGCAMAESARGLIPTEFMYVNYGALLREYLLTRVTLVQVHLFDPSEVQFDDALVSSAIIIYRKSAPADSHRVQFSFGGTLEVPGRVEHIPSANLRSRPKWPGHNRPLAPHSQSSETALGDLFAVKRGVATGANGFFIVDDERIRTGSNFLTTFLPLFCRALAM